MKKVTSILISAGVSTAVVVGSIVPTVLVLSSNEKTKGYKQDLVSSADTSNDDFYFYLPSVIEGKYIGFNSIDDVINQIFGSLTDTKVRNMNFVGDFSSSINPYTNRVDVSKGVYEYKLSKIADAYKTADNQFSMKRFDATKSYLSQTDKQYMDANGYLHSNFSDAQTANNEYKKGSTIGVSYYKIKDSSNDKEYKINPLNKEDIDYFKRIALRNITVPNSGFTLSPIATSNYGDMNTEDVYSIFNQDSMVKTVFNLLKYFSGFVKNTTWDAKISIVGDGKATIESNDSLESWKPASGPTVYRWTGKPGPSANIQYLFHDISVENEVEGEHARGSSHINFNNIPYNEAASVLSRWVVTQDFNDGFDYSIPERYNFPPGIGAKPRYDSAGLWYTTDEAYAQEISQYYAGSVPEQETESYDAQSTTRSSDDEIELLLSKRNSEEYNIKLIATNLGVDLQYAGKFASSFSEEWIKNFIVTRVSELFEVSEGVLPDTFDWVDKISISDIKYFDKDGKITVSVTLKDADYTGRTLKSTITIIGFKNYNGRIQISFDQSALSSNNLYRFQAFFFNTREATTAHNTYKWSGNNKNLLSFLLDISPDQSVIYDNYEKVVEEVANIIFENLFFKNKNVVELLPDELIYQNIKETCYTAARSILNAFLKSSKTYSTYADDKLWNNAFRDYTSSFDQYDVNTNTRITFLQELNTNSWWANDFLNSTSIDGNNLFYSILNNLNIANSDYFPQITKNSAFVNYNGVPVFAIYDLADLGINDAFSEGTSSVALDVYKWSIGSSYDPTRLINVSNMISYMEKLKAFAVKRDAANITSVNESIVTSYNEKLLKYNVPEYFTKEELRSAQHLLFSQSDLPEQLRNDCGIESAIQLYNDNIDEILTREDREVYIQNIKEKNIATNDVLRLYQPNSLTDQEFQFNSQLRVYYGEVRATFGTFNPSISQSSVLTYQSELDDYISDITPVEVPVVRINGQTYKLAELANPGTDIFTGDLNILLNQATNRLQSYLLPVEDYIYYNVGTVTGEDNWKIINNTIKEVIKYELDIGLLSPEIFANEKVFYFLTPEDGLRYFKSQIANYAIYK